MSLPHPQPQGIVGPAGRPAPGAFFRFLPSACSAKKRPRTAHLPSRGSKTAGVRLKIIIALISDCDPRPVRPGGKAADVAWRRGSSHDSTASIDSERSTLAGGSVCARPCRLLSWNAPRRVAPREGRARARSGTETTNCACPRTRCAFVGYNHGDCRN